MNPFDGVPKDIVLLLMKRYFLPRDAVRFSLTCRRFRKLLPKGKLLDNMCIGRRWEATEKELQFAQESGLFCKHCELNSGNCIIANEACLLKCDPCSVCKTVMPQALWRLPDWFQMHCIECKAERRGCELTGCTRCGKVCKERCSMCGMRRCPRHVIFRSFGYHFTHIEEGILYGFDSRCFHQNISALVVKDETKVPPFWFKRHVAVFLQNQLGCFDDLMWMHTNREFPSVCHMDFPHLKYCFNCYTTEGKLLNCANCGRACYCSKECQVADWPTHKEEVCKWTKPSENVLTLDRYWTPPAGCHFCNKAFVKSSPVKCRNKKTCTADVLYCSKECRQKHWPEHKQECL